MFTCHVSVSRSHVNERLLITFTSPRPQWSHSQAPSYCFAARGTDVGEIIELLWLLWGWTKQNVAGRSQHFPQHIVPQSQRNWTPQTEQYIVSIIFYDSNTFRSMYWVIRRWEDYSVSRCHRAELPWVLKQSVQDALASASPQPPTSWTFLAGCHTVYIRPARAVMVIRESNIGSDCPYQTKWQR